MRTPPLHSLSPLPTPDYTTRTQEVCTLPRLSSPLHSSDQPHLAPPARSFRPVPPPHPLLSPSRATVASLRFDHLSPPSSQVFFLLKPRPQPPFVPFAVSLQPASQTPGVDVPRPPRSMLRGGLGDRAPAEGPRAMPLGAGQMQEAFVVPAGASKASALLREE